MTVADDLFFNPLEPGYIENPHPHLTDLRAHLPVHHTLAGPWALFRYDDVFALLRDPELSVDGRRAEADPEREAFFRSLMAEFDVDEDELMGDTSILNTDPPDHTRLRRLVSKAFTPTTIAGLRPMIQRLVDEALDRMAESGRTDIVDALAFPLPFDVISEMLGMPESDKDQIRDWSEALVKTLDPIVTADDSRAAFLAARNMNAHIDEVITWKRANPADDLLTLLIDAEEDGDKLSPRELRDQVSLLFVAGHETTVNLIGTGIYELLRHPEQADRLRVDESLDANAVEELLRYVAPVQFSARIATRELGFDGQSIPSGAVVMACLASSNRDPEHFGPDADTLDLGRENASHHVSFGSGAHYCLGASLAKLEGQIAIGSFIRRFPEAALVGEPTWNGRINLRGLEHCLVDVG